MLRSPKVLTPLNNYKNEEIGCPPSKDLRKSHIIRKMQAEKALLEVFKGCDINCNRNEYLYQCRSIWRSNRRLKNSKMPRSRERSGFGSNAISQRWLTKSAEICTRLRGCTRLSGRRSRLLPRRRDLGLLARLHQRHHGRERQRTSPPKPPRPRPLPPRPPGPSWENRQLLPRSHSPRWKA